MNINSLRPLRLENASVYRRSWRQFLHMAEARLCDCAKNGTIDEFDGKYENCRNVATIEVERRRQNEYLTDGSDNAGEQLGSEKVGRDELSPH